MAPEPDPALIEIADRIRFTLLAPLDFSRTDHATIQRKVRLLTAAALYFNVVVVTDFGGRGGPARDERLVEQAVAAAFQIFGEHDPHPSEIERAAMLLRGITQGYPFMDGNKRTGFLLATYYLDLVGISAPAALNAGEVISLCLAVSAGQMRDVKLIAAELGRLWGVTS